LQEDVPVVLVLGGGFGIGPMEDIVRSFKDYQNPLQLLVVTGRNEALRERLKGMKDKLGIEMTVFGYVENMHELMSASDLLISKPGGITISEALAKKLPLILVEPVLGQEERNLEFALKKKVALYAEKMEEIPQIVSYLLSHPAEMEEMRKYAEKISHPNSAYDIARVLIEITGKDI
jgi:processive 1,2-diacylglycerol beta-glucosyltransferase